MLLCESLQAGLGVHHLERSSDAGEQLGGFHRSCCGGVRLLESYRAGVFLEEAVLCSSLCVCSCNSCNIDS